MNWTNYCMDSIVDWANNGEGGFIGKWAKAGVGTVAVLGVS